MTARPASRMPAPGRISGRTRAGFTLIELMGVILIIAILIAVALPAFNAVLRNARITTARTEMAAIGTAIGEFKAEYGTEPPSYISFVAANPAALPAATKATLRKMFPQIDFTSTAIQVSLTQAGIWGKELRGSECLVFFLGGVRRGDGTTFTNELTGFSKNPANPFAQQTAQSSRVGPFFDFDSGRLGEVARVPGPTISAFNLDDTAFTGNPLAYVDKLPGQNRPLLYASTAATGFYRATDVPELADGPYRKSSATGPYHNPTSFQIISAGFDTEYGSGGASVADQGADNLTNFSPGLLGDE